ncbi:putative efflux protein, MATE family [Pustulibacterium marinum]|uniref:Multidrug export protein MepA n=1 Tax=Pustulibacterium marinum TaxID=1224947 RepID=A0A1I7ET00_9FLAO|nr:MATE family efflux transporter [Pustulibacterium marinum]SFU27028.1 putative efflux protein, MATE family [Pustulibacterium marinum]
MAKVSSAELGTDSIGKLLVKQALPASIGILVMSLNILIDSVFVGNWIGSLAIGAINIVLPASFFIAALGMAIGIGGASMISRALGSNREEKALDTFGNQISLTVLLTVVLATVGLSFSDTIVQSFGGKGSIFDPAKIYYQIVLFGVPFQGLAMMGSNVVRAEGKPTFAMVGMILPALSNLVLDAVFIYVLDWGMAGAAWATTLSTFLSFLFYVWFFISKKSELKISFHHLKFKWHIVKEIASLGFVTLSRQAVVSFIYLFLNNILFNLGGEALVSVYAIVGRLLMFVLFPVLGVTQGFLPIAGYNYGAEKYDRVIEVIKKSIIAAVTLGIVVFAIIYLFPEAFVHLFIDTSNHLTAQEVEINNFIMTETPTALKIVFAATPIVAIQLIGAAYFQAVGKAIPALLLTLTRQGFFFFPLILILPNLYGKMGVWAAFPIADTLSTIVTAYFLYREIQKKLLPHT